MSHNPGWQPIEVAPKDETILLAHFGQISSSGAIGLLWAASGMLSDAFGDSVWIDVKDCEVIPTMYHTVTHWMRLPELDGA
jgi:hypothetical protein